MGFVDQSENEDLTGYLQRIKHDVLSREEEKALFKKYLKGDSEAEKQLILKNLYLVVSIAAKFRGRGVEFEDLISSGTLGLWTAMEKFDLKRGNKFSTYATWWIKLEIRRALPVSSSVVLTRGTYATLLGIKDKLKRKGVSAQDISFEQFVGITGLKRTAAQYWQLLQFQAQTFSLGSGDNNESVEMRSLSGRRPMSGLENILIREKVKSIQDKVRKTRNLFMGLPLSRHHRKIFEFRSPFFSRSKRTLRVDTVTFGAVGKKTGLTRERVRQVCKDIWKKLGESGGYSNSEELLQDIDTLEAAEFLS